MLSYRSLSLAFALLEIAALAAAAADSSTGLPAGLLVEEQPTDPKKAKIVLVAGSNFFKPGEHEYIAGCAVLMDLLKQTPDVAPVLALDWPKKPETFAGAKAVVFFFDGGDKHALLKDDRLAQLQKLMDARVGLVQFHQGVDLPKDLGDRMRSWAGAAWEKGYSQRAHWIDEFKTFPDHPISHGVTPFKIDDGWLTKLRFVPEMRGITPLLKTVSPKLPEANRKLDDTAIVAWAYDRADGGRSFTFTGGHLHASLAEEGYRRFLTHGILWSAELEIPQSGAPVRLTTENLNKYLAPKPATASQETLPKYAEHQDLSYCLDASGAKQPIKTPSDWAKRREHISAWMQTVMGPLPKPKKPVPLHVRVEEEVAVGELTRRKISYHTDSAERRVKAFLFQPKTEGKLTPAILCLHQTINIGKSEPAGLGGNPNLHYALHLAQRGYVTLAPDYPSFGEYPFDFDSKYGYVSGSMKAIYDNIRAVDLLQSLPEVDEDRIGCIGHSLGGHNTMFTAFFEPRIKVMVSNCGFTRFHKYYGGALKGWTSARYMPLIDSRHHNNPDEVPFDFPEIVASFAPRPFLASSPLRDSNFEVSGVKDTIASAKPIYELLGAADALQANYPDCAHDFPEDVRKVAYEFFDKHLRGK